MSSLTMIKISHKQGFKNKECLEEALAIHDLGSMFAITRVGDKYQLNAILDARYRDKLKMEVSLKEKLDEVVRTILPTYTKLLATDDFGSKDFYLKRETRNLNEEILVFEKINSFTEIGLPEQIVVKIRKDYRHTLDTKNFTGKKCIDTTKQFEEKIGQVITREMKPESATNNRRLLEITVCQ